MDSQTLLQLVIVLVSGLVAGFINTMAGGGSFITLAALEFVGLPIGIANGTNRIAIQAQNIAAIAGFKSKGLSDFRRSLELGIPATLGAILGAYVVIDLPEDVFHKVLGVAMLLMLATLLFDSKKLLRPREITLTPTRRIWGYLVLFAVGFYGGAIQAGVGFLMMAALLLVLGESLVRTNMHKVLIVGLYTLAALIIFAAKGQVDWGMGVTLSVGNGAGAWIASRMSVAKGDKLVKVVLAVMLAVMAVRYLGLIPGF